MFFCMQAVYNATKPEEQPAKQYENDHFDENQCPHTTGDCIGLL